MMIRKVLSLIGALILPLLAISQEVEMADTLRQEGKFYVVVVVIVIIVSGLYAYLFYLDKQIGKLEKQTEES